MNVKPGLRELNCDKNPRGTVKCLDKEGRPFEAEEQSIECLPQLMHMYRNFFPRAISQGLPPPSDADLNRWVKGLLESGWNFVCRQDGVIVGHAAVLPDLEKSDGEYVVFVLQAYRNKGLGTVLTEMAMQKARVAGLHVMWLTVEAFNFRAIKVYKKVGFEFCDEGERERTMMLRL